MGGYMYIYSIPYSEELPAKRADLLSLPPLCRCLSLGLLLVNRETRDLVTMLAAEKTLSFGWRYYMTERPIGRLATCVSLVVQLVSIISQAIRDRIIIVFKLYYYEYISGYIQYTILTKLYR